MSGWILGGKYLDGTSAIAEEPVGKGRVIAFGFQTTYGALTEVRYRFLLNSMLVSGSCAVQLPASAERAAR